MACFFPFVFGHWEEDNLWRLRKCPTIGSIFDLCLFLSRVYMGMILGNGASLHSITVQDSLCLDYSGQRHGAAASFSAPQQPYSAVVVIG